MAAITITGSNTTTGDLTLSNHGNITVSRGSIVTWIIGPNSGVSAITAISNKNDPGSVDVFKPNPSKVPGNSKNWQGTIDPDLSPIPAHEDYSMQWTDEAGNSHPFDPRISVNR